MPLYTQLPDEIEKVDVIVAGGGTAGCIVAARLSEADPALSVLVIEGGRNNADDPSIAHPLLFMAHLAPTSDTTLLYTGRAEPQIGGRKLTVPAGGILGGGSSVNMMQYTRAQRHDWDSWKAEGWSADEMIPYLKKASWLETYVGPGRTDIHGDKGPIAVSEGNYVAKRSQDEFIKAAAQLGYPEHVDLQDLDSNNGVQRARRFVSAEGLRSDTAHAYLHPKLKDESGGNNPNLHVLVQSQVTRVLFEGQKAVGVEYRGNPKFQQNTPVQVRSIRVEKMVILSAGTFGTPLILERSGVGDAAILDAAQVAPLVAHIPGVGRNYQDHHLMTYTYKTALDPDETADAVIAGRVDMGELLRTNAPILGWNAQDVTCKLRPSDAEVAALGPEFQAAYERDFKHNENKPLAMMAPANAFPGPLTPDMTPGQYYTVSAFTVYPYSRGDVHITHAADPDAPVDFATDFLADPLDVQKHVWVYKKQREIARRMPSMYRGELPGTHPPFAADSAAALLTGDESTVLPTDNDGRAVVADIVYTPEDDAVIERWVRDRVGTTWHSLGTCAMRPLERGGVVDSRLGVHGLGRLKVADLSIAPENVAANTANTAMAIGERAADIFIQELGLRSL
ncbi:alcohol oxidase-like protein [Apiospora phragmitis]|uniref:Alcohol oxidase-like protein n=1 Tax=Apiospora phragmitis TaxID=2905665 RepID=A0ABR1T8W3_9PEZI